MSRKWLQPLPIACILLSLIPIYMVAMYMYSYLSPIPFGDQWWVSIGVAKDVRDGTLEVSTITSVTPSGQRVVFTNLHTLLFTYLTGWQPQYEALVNFFLALLNLVLITAIFYRYSPGITHFALVVFSLFIFSVNQEDNWLWSYSSGWHFVAFFILLALFVLVYYPVGWRPWLVAIILGICATFSMAHGMLIWGVFLPFLWVRGYRYWGYLFCWIIIGGVAAYLYVQNSGIGSEENASDWVSYSTDLRVNLPFVLHLLGAPVAAYNYSASFILSALGIILLIIFFIYLWLYQPVTRELTTIWLALSSYGFLTSVMIAFTRLDTLDARQLAFLQRYTGGSLWFWMTVAVCAMSVLVHTVEVQRWKALQVTCITTLMVIGVLYLQTNVHMLQNSNVRYGYTNLIGHRSVEIQNQEICMKNFPSQRDQSCLRPYLMGEIGPDMLYQAALYRLLTYHNLEAVQILPETYQTGSPILINSPSAWLNLYVREMMLDGISEDVLLHIVPNPTIGDADKYKQPLQRVFTDVNEATLSQLDQLTVQSEQIWYITTPEMAMFDEVIFVHLAERSYVPTPYLIQHPDYRTAKFSIYRFQRSPEELETVLSFGEENIQLRSWKIYPSEPVHPCENIYLQSWWESEGVPAFNYSATLVLVSPDNNNVAQKDDAIGETLMQLWHPGQLYFDERILTVPCDAKPGEYYLKWGFYYTSDTGFQDLTVVYPESEAESVRGDLTSVVIEPNGNQ